MSRSAGRSPSRFWLAGPLAAGLVGLAAAPAAAAPAPPQPASTAGARIQLTAPVQQSLLRLQDQWLDWIGAFYQHHEKQAEGVVVGLVRTAQQVGMSRLPDLALAALVPALEAARQGDFERAHWALAAAERLDPGRPETAFAASRVAVGERRFLPAGGWYLLAYGRVMRQPWLRAVWLHDLALWLWTALVATGALCLALLMAARGRRLTADLTAVLERRLPHPLALALALLLLAAPAALPYGAAWLVLAWTVLLWGYLSLSQRAVLAALLLLVGAAPFLAAEQGRRVAVAVSPPMHAVESLAGGQLYGDLFTDLEELRAALPESPAVRHLVADLHRRLGQWDLASAFYQDVLEREAQNRAALLDLGAYYFYRNEFGSAIKFFQAAAASDPRSAAAQFNLSQAYAESYLFDEQHRALEQARALDADRVSAWGEGSEQHRVVVEDGGLARIPEIRRELLAARPAAGAPPAASWAARWLGLALAAAVAFAAAALARSRSGAAEPQEAAAPRGGRGGLWLRALLPGLAAAEAGEGGRSFAALLLPVALLLLPLGSRIGYHVPWGYHPGNVMPWIVAITGLLLYLGARVGWELRHRV
jgi:tetratricopeptide (TPR) repeat protein